MKRKLGIIRALVHRPDLVILDEPTAGLDAASRYTIRGIVQQAPRLPCTLIIATQDLWEAERIATHISILREGRIMYTGSYQGLHAAASLRKYRVHRGVDPEWLRSGARAGLEVINREADNLGTTVLVRTTPGSCAGVPVGDGTLELPVDLEQVFVEMDRQWRNGDAD
jgi:ABC-type multidrug transport system ATPase subunit